MPELCQSLERFHIRCHETWSLRSSRSSNANFYISRHWTYKNMLKLRGRYIPYLCVFLSLFPPGHNWRKSAAHFEHVHWNHTNIFWSLANKWGTDFADMYSISKSSVKIFWYEILDKLITYLIKGLHWLHVKVFHHFFTPIWLVGGEPDPGWFSSDNSVHLKCK